MTIAELSILSLIVERPRHGYEIEQIIEQRGMRDWAEISFSSIYYLLRRLETQKNVRSRIQADGSGGAARRVYSATAAGESLCKEAFEALSQPRRAYVPFLAGLFNLARLPSEARLTALRQYSKKLAERCNLVQENCAKPKFGETFPGTRN